ncbi:KH domain-containing protein [Yarrowia sp. B02]|nr:KH domain-containing protein [Yarrowia sp. B02]
MDIIVAIPLRYTYLYPPPKELWKVGDVFRPLDQESERFRTRLAAKPGTRLVLDNLVSLRKVVSEITDVQANLEERRLVENTVTVSLVGPRQAVQTERTRILRSYTAVARGHVALEDQIVSQCGNDLKEGLTEIAHYCKVSIYVTDTVDKVTYGLGYSGGGVSAADAQKPYHVLIYGDQELVQYAQLRVEILVHKLMGSFVDAIEVPLSMQPLVAGCQLLNIKNIEAQSKCKILFPNWLPELFHVDEAMNLNYDTVFVVGPTQHHTLLAKTLVAEIKNKTQTIYKDCLGSYAKIDLMCLKYQQRLKEVMQKLGAFIQVPFLGASRSVIRVTGISDTHVEQAIAEVMLMASGSYHAGFWAHTGQEDPTTNTYIGVDVKYTEDYLSFIDLVAGTSGATVSCSGSSFEVSGFKADVKRAVSLLAKAPFWPNAQCQLRFRLELPLSEFEFVTGKKNGKINRIMDSSKCFIKLSPFHEYNFFLDIVGDDSGKVLTGVQLLEEEFPSETQFYIPETYHKQVIGSGGHLIQTLMRKYNVFIKFTNGYDRAPNGYSHHRFDNVLVRCPSKNSANIAPTKNDILETATKRAGDHGNTFIKVSRSHRRILMMENDLFINIAEGQWNTCVIFPSIEPSDICENDEVEIRGLLGSSAEAAHVIKNSLPNDYEFKIAYSNRFAEVCSEDNPEFFSKIVVPLRVALKIHVQVYAEPRVMSGQNLMGQKDYESPRYQRIVLSFTLEHAPGLEEAILALTTYLREKELDIIDRGDLVQDVIRQGSVPLNTGSSERIVEEEHNEQEPRAAKFFDVNPGDSRDSRPNSRDHSGPFSGRGGQGGDGGYPNLPYRDPYYQYPDHRDYDQFDGPPGQQEYYEKYRNPRFRSPVRGGPSGSRDQHEYDQYGQQQQYYGGRGGRGGPPGPGGHNSAPGGGPYREQRFFGGNNPPPPGPPGPPGPLGPPGPPGSNPGADQSGDFRGRGYNDDQRDRKRFQPASYY